ncbi:MAG TPA: helix-turn-helix transcriptional regulator [Blastocatellia bacterium]|nr:helix-turn-helix transcriptional regulator [Blastocatellia bacterium]
MGRASRKKPFRLAEKLREARLSLGYAQGPLVEALGLSDEIRRQDISDFETGKREPPLRVLLKYSRLANVYMEVFADDALDLPNSLPCSPKSSGIERKTGPKPRPGKPGS